MRRAGRSAPSEALLAFPVSTAVLGQGPDRGGESCSEMEVGLGDPGGLLPKSSFTSWIPGRLPGGQWASPERGVPILWLRPALPVWRPAPRTASQRPWERLGAAAKGWQPGRPCSLAEQRR